jgi:hypothetical protein
VAFPVLIANLIAALAPDGIPAAIPLGEPLVYEPRSATAAVEITPPSGEPVLLQTAPARQETGDETPAETISREVVYADTGAAGAYTVTEKDESGADLGSTRFVVNAGHPRESDLRLNHDLAGVLATASGAGLAAPRQERFDLWPVLALVALVVIGAEWIAILWTSQRVAVHRSARGGAA